MSKRRYIRDMKIKTSVTISENLLKMIDEFAADDQDRSAFLEAAAWAYIARRRRSQQNMRDLEIINQQADQLNAEMMDVLEYQVDTSNVGRYVV